MNNLEKGITLTRLLRKITNSVLNQNIFKKKKSFASKLNILLGKRVTKEIKLQTQGHLYIYIKKIKYNASQKMKQKQFKFIQLFLAA